MELQLSHECVIDINCSEKFISLNDWYAGGCWQKRQANKKKYNIIFRNLLKSYENLKLDKIKVTLDYNLRYDCDNSITIIKLFVDSLKDMGIIDNDCTKIFQSLEINFNKNLKSGTTNLKVWKLQ